jgi:type I restriction enzyme S subunit
MVETKFKQTEIGLIPEDWEVFSVMNDCIVKARIGWQGLKTSEYLSSGEYGLITSTDIVNGRINWSTCVFVNRERYFQDGNIIVKNGDVLVSKDGTIGKVGIIADMPFPATLNSGVFVIRTKSSFIRQKGLSLAFISPYFLDFIKKLTAGSTIVHLYQKDIVDYKFPLPQKTAEQERIVDALFDVDKLISSLSKTIEKKRLIKQGAMQQLLTGKKRLPGFNGEWEEILLGECAKIYRGGSPRPIEQFITNRPDGVNWIKIGDVSSNARYVYKTEEKIIPEGIAHSREVHKGDFVLSNSMSYGRPYILMIDGCIHDGWLVIKDYRDTFDMVFLYYVLSSDNVIAQYVSMAAGSSVKNLNKEKVSSLTIFVPRSIKEQSAIAEILNTMDNEIESLEEERDKYIRLKEGMMQKLLTGQIRLVEAETKQQDLPKAKAANVYFKRSVLAAEIVDRLCEERTFGHVKMEKLIFLTEHLCHIDIDSHYHRDAAGPYDNRALRSIDSQMKKQKWFEAKKEDKGYRYIPMQNRGGHKKYFEKYYADVMPMFDKIIDTFRSSTTEQCEIVATLYSAWDDLLQSHQSFTDDDILNEVLNNWHESKKRISRNRWQTELDWMRANGFMPQTENN